MSLRIADHPVLLVPFLFLLASFVIHGELSLLLTSIAFLIVLYIGFTSDVKVEKGRVILYLGRPVPLAMSEIFLSEIVEIIEVPSMEGVRLLDYLERPWVVIGVALIGLLIGSIVFVEDEAYGLLWVYMAGIFLLDYIFRPSEGRKQMVSVLILSILTGIVFLFLGEWGFAMSVALYGVFFSMMTNENYTKEALILRTERGRVVLLGSPESKERFLKELRRALGGN
jgi:hypothetical protein